MQLANLGKALGILLCYWMFSTDAMATAGKAAPPIGTKPPALVLREVLHGPPLNEITWEKFHGKVVVLEFWNMRCGPCIAAIPHMNSLVEQFDGKPVVFLAITDDHPERAREFLKGKPMKSWVVTDGPLQATRTAFDVKGIPHVVLVNPEGIIAATTHPAKLKPEHLEELLAGKPSSLPLQDPYQPYADEEGETVPVENRPKLIEVSFSGPHPQPDGAYNIRGWDSSRATFNATNAFLKDAIAGFFDVEPYQVIASAPLPEGLFDLFISVPHDKTNHLQSLFIAGFETAFGTVLKTNGQEMEVYELRFGATNGPALLPAEKRRGGGGDEGGFLLRGTHMNDIASFIGHYLGKKVIDKTESTNLWAAELRWSLTDAQKLLGRLRDQLDEETITGLQNTSGPISPELLTSLRNTLSAEDLEVFQQELQKPREQQFKIDTSTMVESVRAQLGLELILTNRMVDVVEVLNIVR
ncbi:MAG: TIGR03435 family protein [Limisphaerales bacterium]